jgi:uncharacterized membrane protein YidH (DUF202 family)
VRQRAGAPDGDGGLQPERTDLAATRTALSLAAAALALVHVAQPPRPASVVLLAASVLGVVATSTPRLREARGLRLAALAQLALVIATCALAAIATR